jgi:hypothetical protein
MTKEGSMRGASAKLMRPSSSYPAPSIIVPSKQLALIVITHQPLFVTTSTNTNTHHVRPISVSSLRPSNSHCFAFHCPLTPGQRFPPPAMPHRTRHQSRELLKKFLGQRTEGYWPDA